MTWLFAKSAVLAMTPGFLRRKLDRLKASPLGSRLAKGTAWALVGTFISRGLWLVSSAVVARKLGKEGFGELGIIQSTVGLFGTFAGLGLGLTAAKHVAELRTKDPARAGRIIGLSGLVAWGSATVMAVVLFALAPWVAKNTLGAPHLTGLLQIGAALLFLNAVNGAQTGALSGFEAFKTNALVNLWAGIAVFPLMVGGVLLYGLRGVVWALVASAAVNWILSHLALRRHCARAEVPLSFTACFREWRILVLFTLPAFLSNVMWGPANWACRAIIVNQAGGYAEMGLYNAATQLSGIVSFLPGVLGSVLLPIFANIHGQGDKPKFSYLLKLQLVLQGCMGAVMALPFICAPDFIMSIFGGDFTHSANLVRLAMLTVIFNSTKWVAESAVMSTGAMWKGLVASMLLVATTVPAAYMGRRYGAMGLATAFLSGTIVSWIWCMWCVYKITRCKAQTIT